MRHFTLRFGQVNVGSLMSKMCCLTDFVRTSALDVVAVGETWPTSAAPSSFVSLDAFEVVRGDTGGSVCKHGVCLFVRREFVLLNAACTALMLQPFTCWMLMCGCWLCTVPHHMTRLAILSSFC